MPPTTLLPTAGFRCLLLPSVYIRLRTLHSFAHPRSSPTRPPCAGSAAAGVVQRRSLHLYKTAKAKTALGMHKVLDFELYEPEPPSASQHHIDIVKDDIDLQVLHSDLSLQHVYDKLISPGNVLYMIAPVGKALSVNPDLMRQKDVPSQTRAYAILPAHSTYVPIKNPQIDMNQYGALKVVNLSLSTPTAHLKASLDRMYHWVKSGSPVEVRIRFRASWKQKSAPVDPNMWPWLSNHFPHLRPDFLLKSMPEGTIFVIEPVTDGTVVQFTFGQKVKGRVLDLTERLFNVKTAVHESLSKNKMAQNWLRRKGQGQVSAVTAKDGQDAESNSVDGQAGRATKKPQRKEKRPVERYGVKKSTRSSRGATSRSPRSGGIKNRLPQSRGKGFELSSDGEAETRNLTPGRS